MPLSAETIVAYLVSRRSDLLAYILSIVNDEHLAEDVLQEVFIVATRKSDQIVDQQHLSRWAWKTARFEALNAMRKSARSPYSYDMQTLDLIDETWHQIRETGDERSAALRDCINRLSPYARQLIELRYGEGLKTGELARRVGRQVETVYTALSRIHTAIRKCISSKQRSQT